MNNKKFFAQVFRFGMAGGICFVIDTGTLILLTEIIGLHYLLSSACSFILSVVINYFLSTRFVFDTKASSAQARQFGWFFGLSGGGLLLNQLLMLTGVDGLQFHYLLVKVVATGIVMVYNFITRKLLLEHSSQDLTEQ